MATNTVQITGLPLFSDDYAAALSEHIRRYVAGNSGAYETMVAAANRSEPGAPTTVAGSDAAAHSVITWVAPTTGSSVVYYEVKIYKSSDDSLLNTTLVDGALLTKDVLNLAANTAYAKVTAYNEQGAGSASAASANFTIS